jgi:hypothetical protein
LFDGRIIPDTGRAWFVVPDSASITKPFHYPELLARIGAVLGRVSRGRDRQVIR